MTYVHDVHDGEFLVATYSQGKNTISVEMASTTSNLCGAKPILTAHLAMLPTEDSERFIIIRKIKKCF